MTILTFPEAIFHVLLVWTIWLWITLEDGGYL